MGRDGAAGMWLQPLCHCYRHHRLRLFPEHLLYARRQHGLTVSSQQPQARLAAEATGQGSRRPVQRSREEAEPGARGISLVLLPEC